MTIETTIEHLAIRPGDPGYDEARTTFAGTADPAVVLRPGTAPEVAAAIRFAREQRLPLAVRSGGHNALGFGAVDGGVVVDLSRLDRVEILGDGRVRIGTGATWGPVATTLAGHGLAISSGDTTSVGVGGLTQAGGIGWMVRKHGLTIDSLLAAEVVTAAGHVVRASATENPDLFWALRGGAGNFGVVTAFELQAQPVSTVQFGTITYAPDDLPQLLKGWATVMRSAPDELSTTLVLMPGFGGAPGGALLFACLAGTDTAALEGLRTIGTVVAEDVGERPYASILEEGRQPEGVVPVVNNALVEAVDEPLVEAIVAAHAAGGRGVFLRSLGGAFGRVGPADTAFAHRGAEALVVSVAFLPADAGDAQIEGARAGWRPIGEHGVGSYAGFLGTDTPEDIAALWPEPTLGRLRQVKRAWDPGNVFRRNFNIAP
jgi:FAD/FMN-containing dehydrogenase